MASLKVALLLVVVSVVLAPVPASAAPGDPHPTDSEVDFIVEPEPSTWTDGDLYRMRCSVTQNTRSAYATGALLDCALIVLGETGVNPSHGWTLRYRGSYASLDVIDWTTTNSRVASNPARRPFLGPYPECDEDGRVEYLTEYRIPDCHVVETYGDVTVRTYGWSWVTTGTGNNTSGVLYPLSWAACGAATRYAAYEINVDGRIFTFVADCEGARVVALEEALAPYGGGSRGVHEFPKPLVVVGDVTYLDLWPEDYDPQELPVGPSEEEEDGEDVDEESGCVWWNMGCWAQWLFVPDFEAQAGWLDEAQSIASTRFPTALLLDVGGALSELATLEGIFHDGSDCSTWGPSSACFLPEIAVELPGSSTTLRAAFPDPRSCPPEADGRCAGNMWGYRTLFRGVLLVTMILAVLSRVSKAWLNTGAEVGE